MNNKLLISLTTTLLISNQAFANYPTENNETHNKAVIERLMVANISDSPYSIDADTLDKKSEDKKDHDKAIMERVMVIGSSDNVANIAGSAFFIDADNLDKHNYSDVNSVLKQVPGINIQQEDGFGNRPNIGFRGGRVDRSADITLMEDGVLVAPAPYSAPSAYYFPRISRMESVEVRKGSSTIEFGPRTTSGALNLISSSTPDKFEFDALMGYGSFDTKKTQIHHGDKIKNFSYVIDLGHEESAGFKKIDIVGGDTGYSMQDIMTKMKFTTDDDADIYQSIELKLGYTEEDSDETYLGLSDADFNDDPYRRYAASQKDNMTASHNQYQLRHFIDFNSFDLTTTLYRNEFSRNWYKLNANDGDITDNSDQSGLTVRANNRDYYSQGIQSIVGTEVKTGKVDHKLKFSARFHQDEEDRFQRNDTYDLTDGIMVLTDYGIDGDAGDAQISADATALYFSDEMKYKKLTLTPGLRYEHIKLKRVDNSDPTTNNANEVNAFVPGIGSIYQFNSAYSTFASIHKGFAPPTPSSSDPKEEESTNYELGMRFNKNGLKSELVGFFNDYSNLLGKCTASSGNNCTEGDQINAGEVEVKGFEVSSSYDIAKHFNITKYKLPITANYTYTSAKFKDSFDGASLAEWGEVQAGDKLPYVAKDQFYVAIGLVRPKWEVHLNGKYIGKMRSTAGNGEIASDEVIASHFILDFATEFAISKKVKLFVNIENLSNETYIAARRPIGARPGKPLSLFAGLKYKF